MKAIQSECEGGRFLPPSFFARDTLTVARDLLGREIVRRVGGGKKAVLLRARIVETEAYLEKGDAAAHCSRGPTPRAKVMFGEPGVIYVYFIYGNYFMLNFVTERKGKAGAVLIRAAEPIEGVAEMARLRNLDPRNAMARQLTNGPAKLAMALGVDGSLNDKALEFPRLVVAEGVPVAPNAIVTTTRVGISVAKDLPYRFYEKGNPYVSRL